MNGKQIFETLSRGGIPNRIPFVPTIFEHAARLMSVTPSELAKDINLLIEGQLRAYELYRHDLVSVGVDVYNVEAEAIGCPIEYYHDQTMPSVKGGIINNLSDLKNLTIPNPRIDGRMPIFLEATHIISDRIGSQVPVSGAIVGPFTLAAILRGFENFIMDLLFDPEFAIKQLSYSRGVGRAYAKAFIDAGLGVAINESWISPPLLSPNLFNKYVFDFERGLISDLKELGLNNVALICGGNTRPIADLLVKTGTSLLIADPNTEQKEYKALCEAAGINLRVNIASKLVEECEKPAIEGAVRDVIQSCASNGRFIFGCGVVSYNTPPENILFLKTLLEKYNPYKI